MFIRNPYDTETYQQAGPWAMNALGAEPVDTTDRVLLTRLHALALALYQAQQDVLAAQDRDDVAYVQKRLQDIQRLRDLFATTAAQFRSNDPQILGAVDRFILVAGNWIDGAVKALPRSIAAIPNALIEALALIFKKLQGEVFKLTLPILLLGGAVLFFALKTADRSPTAQRVIARATR